MVAINDRKLTMTGQPHYFLFVTILARNSLLIHGFYKKRGQAAMEIVPTHRPYTYSFRRRLINAIPNSHIYAYASTLLTYHYEDCSSLFKGVPFLVYATKQRQKVHCE